MTPALRALREHFPHGELHLLVPEEIAPLFQHLPWLNRVWPMPRRRGRASLSRNLAGHPRACAANILTARWILPATTAAPLLSLLIGARQRLGWAERGGFWGRQFCYNQRVAPETKVQHESARLAHLLVRLENSRRHSLEAEIRADPALAAKAKKLLPPGTSSLPRRFQPAEKGMAAGALGSVASTGRRRRIGSRFHHRRRRAGSKRC